MIQEKQNRSAGKWSSFIALVLGLIVLSFIGLPSLAEISSVKDRIELNEAKKINGGATFYTDQPFLEKVLARYETRSISKESSTDDR
jgi:hypothetical protein